MKGGGGQTLANSGERGREGRVFGSALAMFRAVATTNANEVQFYSEPIKREDEPNHGHWAQLQQKARALTRPFIL